jgi:oligopeptide transport system permease protein
MGRYLKPLALRLLQFFLSLLILLIMTFGLLRFFPGSPLNDEENLNPQIQAHLQNFYGLNESLSTQLSRYLQHVITGDFGSSMHFVGRSVNSLIFEFGQTSAFLGFLAFFVSLIGAFLYSFLTRFYASRRQSADLSLLVLVSLPSLALGPFLIWLFGFYLNWTPVALLDSPISYVLPVLILAFKPTLALSRVLSSSLDSVMDQKYIQTARAMGFSQQQILLKWALKNSMTSFLSQAGPLLASLISGSFLVEILFAIPGLGLHFVESVLNRDWPLILGLTLFYGVILMITQLITDLFIFSVDPRVETL